MYNYEINMMKLEKRLTVFLIIAMMLAPILAYNANASSHIDFNKSTIMDDYQKDCHKEDQKESKTQKASCSGVEFFGFVQLFSNLIVPNSSTVILALLLVSLGLPPVYRLFKPPRACS